jgi:hypothetical protein
MESDVNMALIREVIKCSGRAIFWRYALLANHRNISWFTLA